MAYRIRVAATPGAKPPPRLLDQVRAAIRTSNTDYADNFDGYPAQVSDDPKAWALFA